MGKRLREYRLRQGLSQTDLAGDTLSPSAVSLLESGRREPTPHTLEILAQRLGCTVEYLRDGVSPEAGATDVLRLMRVELALRTGNPSRATDLLREVGEAGGCAAPLQRQRLTLLRALASEESGDAEQAVAELEELVANASEQQEWFAASIALARCYRKTGQIIKSVETASAVVDRVAESGIAALREQAEAYGQLMLALDEAGMAAEAVRHARTNLDGAAVSPWRERAASYDRSSHRAEELGRLTEALWLAERGLGLLHAAEDELAEGRLRTTSASLLMRGGQADLPRVRRALTEAYDIFQAYGTPAERGWCEVELAREALLSGSPESAVAWAERALADLADGAQVLPVARGHLLLGRGLFALGRPEPARDQAKAAVALLRTAPTSVRNAEAWREAGELLRDLQLESEALDALSEALAALGVGARTQE